MILLVIGFVASNRAMADDVLIVVSSDSAPYIEAAKSSEDTLRSNGHTPKRVMLDKLSDSQLRQQTGAVVAIGAKAAESLGKDLPAQTRLYYCMTPSPEQLGLTDRTHTAGLSTNPDVDSQINLIRESGLGIKRVGLLYRSGNIASAKAMTDLERAMPETWSLTAIDLDTEGSISGAIKALFKSDIDLVWTSADPAVYNTTLIKALLLESLRQKTPVFGFSHMLVRAGAAMGIGINPGEQGKRLAGMLDRREIDVHAPPSLHLAINLIVADRISIDFDNKFERRAEIVYKAD